MSTRQSLMRLEIGNAAARLFSQNGIRGVTLRDVAAEVGLSKAAIYNYFDSKESLVAFVFGDWAERSVRPFRELRKSTLDPISKIRRAIALRIAQTVGDAELFGLSIREENNLPDSVRLKFRRSKRLADHLIREMIEEGQADGSILPLDSHIAEFALMGMCNWLFRWFDPAGAQSPADVAEIFSRIFLFGISADGTSEGSGHRSVDGLTIEDHLAVIEAHSSAIREKLESRSRDPEIRPSSTASRNGASARRASVK